MLRNRVLARLFFTLMLVIVVPLTILFAAFSAGVEMYVVEDYMQINERVVSSICETANTYIAARTDFTYALSTNNSIRMLAAGADDSLAERNKACQNVNGIMRSMQAFGNVFSLTALYFPERGFVVSSRGVILDAETFYRRFVAFEGVSADEFYKTITYVRGYAYFPMAAYGADSGEAGKRVMYVKQLVELGYIEPRAVFISMIDEISLNDMLTGAFESEVHYRLLASGDTELARSKRFPDALLSGENHPVIEGAKYYGYRRAFAQTGLAYEFFVPSALVIRKLQFFKAAWLASAAFCLLLGVWIARSIARKLYEPFERLMSASFPDGSHGARTMVEGISLARGRMLEAREQNVMMRAELVEYYQSTRDNALIMLITQSAFLADDEMNRLNEVSELNAGACVCQVALVQCDSEEEITRIYEALKGKESGGALRVVKLSLLRLAVADVRPRELARDESDIPILLMPFLSACRVGLSRAHEGLRSLSRCLTEADAVCQSDGKLVSFTDEGAQARRIDYPIEKEIQLIALVRDGKAEEARRLLNDLRERNREARKLTSEMMLCLYADLAATAMKAAEQSQSAAREGEKLLMLLRGSACEDDAAFDMLISLYDQLCARAKQVNQSRNQRIISDVLAFLEENYADANLCLDIVADQMGVSYYFLSHIFRVEANRSFSDMLNDIRIDRALDLLGGAPIPIQDVATGVGYTHLTTFLRAFKKRTGTTPTRFRNSGGT